MIIGMFHARRIFRFFFSLLPLALIPLFFLLSSSSFFLSSCPCRRNGGSNSKNHHDLIPSVSNSSYISQSRCPRRQSLFKSPLAVSFRFVCPPRLAIILYPFVQILLACVSSCRRYSCFLSLINLNEKERKRVKDATILCAVLSNEPKRSVRYLLFSFVSRIADFAAGMQRRRNRGKRYIHVRCTLRSFLSPDNIRLCFFFSFSFAFSCTRLFSVYRVSLFLICRFLRSRGKYTLSKLEREGKSKTVKD